LVSPTYVPFLIGGVMKIPSAGLMLVAATVIGGCGAAPNPESSTLVEADAQSAILAQSQSHVEAWLRNDAAAIAAHLTEDVVISAPGMADLKGRTVVEQTWRDMLTQSRVAELIVRPDPIIVSGGLGLEAGEFDEIIVAQGQPDTMAIHGRYVSIWQRQPNGDWKMVRFMTNDR
jgi:ketosteroid isomerase-like protein